MAKGDYSVRFDADGLRSMIAEGRTAKEIQKQLKISPYTLWEHLTMLQDRDRKIYFIKGLFESEEKKAPDVKGEGIIFSREILKKTGFEPGDAFEMTVEDDRVILKKIDSE